MATKTKDASEDFCAKVKSLKGGDVVEADKLLPGLSKEKIVWYKSEGPEAEGFYYGIKVFSVEVS